MDEESEAASRRKRKITTNPDSERLNWLGRRKGRNFLPSRNTVRSDCLPLRLRRQMLRLRVPEPLGSSPAQRTTQPHRGLP
ncbi:hypothetical protein J4Q44_G00198810 [Coregonus suidteri]|uniref:Uncharacterized protein n=1 Tax=Coregonus suidteri TaxID=861788 RepID=A0AAN8LPT4_9TELE